MSLPRIVLAFILAFLCAASASATISFGPPQNTPVGTFPSRVVSGDFDGDGKTDVLVLNRDSHSVTVLLGNGDGTFRTGNTYTFSVGIAFPTDLAVGDFNKDGRLDMVVSVGLTGTDGDVIYVFLGNGDGTFQPPTSYSANGSPMSLAVVDINEDGKPDIIVGNNGQSLSLFFGKGDGTFQPVVQATYRGPSQPAGAAEQIVVGDFNKDGHQDVAIADLFDLAILLGNGDGTFKPANFAPCADPNVSNEHCNALVAGDFNGDGKLDLAVTEYESFELRIYLGNGDGTLQPRIIHAAGRSPVQIASADFNLDGKLDVAIAASADNAVTVLGGDGAGNIQEWNQFAVQVNPVAVTIADVNGDSMPDLIVANSGSNSISVLLNTTNTPPFGWLDVAADATTGNNAVPQSSTLHVAGWAADRQDGSSLAEIALSIDGSLVGTAKMGFARPDVAAAYNDSRYANSGWVFDYNIGSLAIGAHRVEAVAYDSQGAYTQLLGSGSFTVTGNTPPFGWLDTQSLGQVAPNATLQIAGWAADKEGGSPVSKVQLVLDGTTVLGNASLGIAREDVAAAFSDPRYTNSGWSFSYNVAGLASGTHSIIAVAYDTQGASTQLRGAGTFTVNTLPFGWVDTRSLGTVAQNATVQISGWAADKEDGAPLAKVQIILDGSTVIGNASLNFARPDVAAAFNDGRYTNSGWVFSYNVGSLSSGQHTVTAIGYDLMGASSQLRGAATFNISP